MKYIVKWEIDIFDASDPTDAAVQALNAVADPDSTAKVFEVSDENDVVTRVDLFEGSEFQVNP